MNGSGDETINHIEQACVEQAAIRVATAGGGRDALVVDLSGISLSMFQDLQRCLFRGDVFDLPGSVGLLFIRLSM